MDTSDDVLDDAIAQCDGECLQREGDTSICWALQEKTGIGNLEHHFDRTTRKNGEPGFLSVLLAVLPWYLSSLFFLPDSFLQLNEVEECSDLGGSGQSFDSSFAWRDYCVESQFPSV